MGVFRHRIGIKEEKKGAVKVPLPVRKEVLVSRGCSRLLDGFCAGSITASKGVGGLVAEITGAKIAFIPHWGF